LVVTEKAGELAMSVRKRKGLKLEMPKLDDYMDRL